jgi:acyl carrier protein
MNDDALERQVRAALYAIAPDLEAEPLDPNRRYRDQFEFDSMDFLRYVVELNRRSGVNIPEGDYTKLETVAGAVAYLRERSGRRD